MLKNEQKNTSWAHENPQENSKESILDYTWISQNSDGTAKLKVDLYTGRHHQIRAQLAAIGCPIVGDTKYGSKIYYMEGKAICLCASRLIFKKATEEEVVELEVDPEF